MTPVLTDAGRRVVARDPGDTTRRSTGTGAELVVACTILIAVGLGGLYFTARPGPTPLDRFVLGLLSHPPRAGAVTAVTRLGSPPVVVAGSVAGCLVAVARRPRGALAALGGPGLAAVACDAILKPTVNRTFDGVSSFPSGTVAVVAAMATVAVLVCPVRWRWCAAAMGLTATTSTAMAVIALHWHYPTDVLGGVALGVGVVLFLDALTVRRSPTREGATCRPPRYPTRATDATDD
jgi:membrane-associated phospholipid phosphatase